MLTLACLSHWLNGQFTDIVTLGEGELRECHIVIVLPFHNSIFSGWSVYRVTIQLVQNLLLTLIWKLRFSLVYGPHTKPQLSHQCQGGFDHVCQIIRYCDFFPTHLSSLSARMPMTLQVCVTTPERPRSAARPITLLAFLSDSRGTRSRSNSNLKMRKSDSRLQNYVHGDTSGSCQPPVDSEY